MPPLVGAEGVSPIGFLALDTLGAFLWSGFYVGLGYTFSNQLDLAISWVKHFGIVVGTAVGFRSPSMPHGGGYFCCE
jgi:membrane protein DedA with SNARE-associated domain